MKTTWDELMQYAPEEEYALAPLSASELERIREKTMKKINRTTKRRAAKPLRIALLAAAITAMLCGTVFAAYSNGWFGLERAFGGKAALLEGGTTRYGDDAALSLPQYTGDETAMIEAGTMQVPGQAELLGGATAQTDAFTFTLESMTASESGLYAIVRAEARDEAAARCLAALEADTAEEGDFFLWARNDSGEGHEREWKNGAMGSELLSREDDTAWLLVMNNGGEFALGDDILFQLVYDGQSFDLFSLPLTALMQTEKTVSLDASAWAGTGRAWQTLTLTPIEFRLDGVPDGSAERTTPEVEVTLRDGTTFCLASVGNGFAHADFGEYGSLSFAGSATQSGEKVSWLFSRLLSPEEVAAVTIDGVSVTLD